MRRLLLLTTTVFLVSLAFAAPAPAAWVWPLNGEVVTTYRNGEDPYAAGQHRGIDIAGPVGAAVVAAAGGEVRFAGPAGSSGLTVSVRTGDGFDTSYLHLGSVQVRAGEHVSPGQRLGAVGTSGVRSTAAPHLHFGVRAAGERHAYLDPLAFLPPPTFGAPEQPAPAPAPAPAPVAPVAAPVPVAAPGPRRVPAGRRIPAARRLPARRRVPARHRVPATRRTPAPQLAPDVRRVPGMRPLPSARVPVTGGLPAADRPAPRTTESPGPSAARLSEGVDPAADGGERDVQIGPDAAATPLSRAPAAPEGAPPARQLRARPSGGPDVGWALACAGVLLAAASLALSGKGPDQTARKRPRLVALVRPLLGKR
jgi:Peptidase family M23